MAERDQFISAITDEAMQRICYDETSDGNGWMLTPLQFAISSTDVFAGWSDSEIWDDNGKVLPKAYEHLHDLTTEDMKDDMEAIGGGVWYESKFSGITPVASGGSAEEGYESSATLTHHIVLPTNALPEGESGQIKTIYFIYIDPNNNEPFLYAVARATDYLGYESGVTQSFFFNFTVANTDELTNNRTYGGKALDIELLKVNPENGKYTDADYQEILDNFTNIHIPNISRLFRVDNFDITTSTYKDDTMGTLQNLNDLTITGAGKISSEVKYINNSMNSIRASVRSSSYLGGIETMNFRSSSGIPGCIGKYISAYYALVNQLLNYIALETEAVNSYGQAMVDMDNAMKNDALEIGEVVALDFDKNSKLDSSYTPVLDKKNDINITNGNNTNTNTNTNTNNRPSGSNTNNTGTNNSGGNNNNNNGYNYQEPEPEVLDEPKTYNFEFDDKHKAIIDTDGTKITNIRYQYTYKNMLEAKEASEKLLAEYQNKDFFDKIQVAGNKVYIYFKKDSFENLDMSQIQAKYLKGAKMING